MPEDKAKLNSEVLMNFLSSYFTSEHFPVSVRIKEIICGSKFDEYETTASEIFEIYEKIVNNENFVIESFKQGFIGCKLNAQLISEQSEQEIIVIFQFN